MQQNMHQKHASPLDVLTLTSSSSLAQAADTSGCAFCFLQKRLLRVLMMPWAYIRTLVRSGTILLEAALIAHNIAPGLRRSFAAEDWPLLCDPRDWERLRKVAEEGVVQAPAGVEIFGADIDQRAVEMTYLHLQVGG